MFSDSHCHLDTYRPEQLAAALEQARAKHVDIMVSMGSNLKSSAEVIWLAQAHEGVKAAVGIHPWNAVLPDDEIRKSLYALTRNEKVVAIGEIGLDYNRNPETREVQKELLKFELSLARETGLPVNIHCRGAYQDMMAILRKEKGIKGIIHGFNGDVAALKDWLDLGFYVSLGFRGFVINEVASLPAAVRELPLERLITETDSVAGEVLRGPADVLAVVQKIASIKGAKIEDIASASTANLKRLLKL